MSARWKAAAGHAWSVAAVGLVVVAARFAVVAFGAASAKADATPAPSSSQAPPRGAERSARPLDSQASASTGTPPPAGAPIRVKLMVMAGPDRSDVFADDSNVGKTPFVGDFSCRTGEKVHFRIVPPTGAPIDLDRPCAPGTIKVEGDR